jgi:CheY-like chemotaxis protein
MEERSRLTCPKCGWNNVRSSPRRGISDGLLRIFLFAPFRCRKCRLRFYRPTAFWTPNPVEIGPVAFASTVPAPESSVSILVLDDDEMLRTLFRRLLEKDGYRVSDAASSNEVNELDGLDLVIANLSSGAAEGLKTVRALWAKRPELKIMALSDCPDMEMLQAEALPGKLTIMEMPQRAQSLVGSVRDFLPSQPKSVLSPGDRH